MVTCNVARRHAMWRGGMPCGMYCGTVACNVARWHAMWHGGMQCGTLCGTMACNVELWHAMWHGGMQCATLVCNVARWHAMWHGGMRCGTVACDVAPKGSFTRQPLLLQHTLCNEDFRRKLSYWLALLTYFYPPLRFRKQVPTFAVRETVSLGIMEAPRVPPSNPSETIVF